MWVWARRHIAFIISIGVAAVGIGLPYSGWLTPTEGKALTILGFIAIGLAVILFFLSRGEGERQEGKTKPSQKNRVRTSKNNSHPPTPARPRSLMPPEDIFFATKIETMVWRNHGHRDEIGIEAEWREHIPWTEIQKGNCTICGKPRNQETWEEKGV